MSEGSCAVTGRLLSGCESEARHSHCRALVGALRVGTGRTSGQRGMYDYHPRWPGQWGREYQELGPSRPNGKWK